MKRIDQSSNRQHAIRRVLGQLGWHVKTRDVVALLAQHGIKVSPDLVNKVKADNLKQLKRMERHQMNMKSTAQCWKRPLNQKKPPQKSYRR